MSDPSIQLGSTGDAVKKAQHELIFRYYLPPGADNGTFGPETRRRVLRYQLDRIADDYQAFSFPLEVDGVIGPKTWARLAPPEIKKDANGDAVLLVQQILKNYGNSAYDPGALDGKFGKNTEGAVENFQRDHTDFDGKPLVVDRIVGERTWRALWS